MRLVGNLPVVGQIEILGKLFEASLVVFECSHEEARGFGRISSPPFFASLFMVDTHCSHVSKRSLSTFWVGPRRCQRSIMIVAARYEIDWYNTEPER